MINIQLVIVVAGQKFWLSASLLTQSSLFLSQLHADEGSTSGRRFTQQEQNMEKLQRFEYGGKKLCMPPPFLPLAEIQRAVSLSAVCSEKLGNVCKLRVIQIRSAIKLWGFINTKPIIWLNSIWMLLHGFIACHLNISYVPIYTGLYYPLLHHSRLCYFLHIISQTGK